jgi:sugar phosphate isomerase/epimerase
MTRNPTMTVRARPGAPGAARDLIGAASQCLVDAALAEHPRDQYARAHLAALRAAAAVLACHARPTRRRGPRSAWELLAMVAPDLSEWAAFFAAGAAKRAAAEAGLGQISSREAADLIREAECFLDLVCTRLQVARQPGLTALSYAG